MKRRLFTLASLLSLLVCVTTVVLWLRSYLLVDDLYVIYRGEGSEHLNCTGGTLAFRHTDPSPWEKRGGILRLSHHATRAASVLRSPLASKLFIHHEWHGLTFDAVAASQVRKFYDLKRALKQLGDQSRLLNADVGRAFQQDSRPAQRRRASLAWNQMLSQEMTLSMRLAALGDASSTRWQVSFPAWLLALCAAILPAAWSAGLARRSRRRLQNHCISCGYDLRASPERCPECGTRVWHKARVAT